ncbi:hypothetical protein [Leucothrix mucor]|uniref:hypothetical protein n=1 Tax=Leucothrix mucor TaxID=45248 RepID=UPI0003B3E631|nr:hypothetical protein [Leucothrix mucor]
MKETQPAREKYVIKKERILVLLINLFIVIFIHCSSFAVNMDYHLVIGEIDVKQTLSVDFTQN